MRMSNMALAGSVILAAIAGTAVADDEWQTVSLGNKSDYTIAIPASVGAAYTPKKKNAAQGELMDFAMQTDDGGGLLCYLNRFPNGKPADEKKFRAMLATERRNVLCQDDKATNLTIGGSDSLTVDGQPAAECVASYTVSDPAFPGRVMNATEILGAKAHFLLTCYYLTTSQDEATASWVARWSKTVAHIQQSLRLPAKEK
jgi:hypothetical protein